MGDLPASAEADVADHVAACPDCRAVCDDYRRMIVQLRSSADPTGPRPAFEAGARAAVRTEVHSARRRIRIRRAGVALGAAAATLLLAVAVGHLAGNKPDKRPDGCASQRASAEQWRLDGALAVPTSAAGGVVVRGERMYVVRRGDGGHHVAAVSVTTGDLIWESGLESRGYLAADDQRVYCLTPASRRTIDLVALDAATGRPLWRFGGQASLGLRVPCRPVPLPRGRVCWTARDTVHMLDAASGLAIWTRSFPDEGPLSPAWAWGGQYYVASSRALYCLSGEAGADTCRHPLDASGVLRSRPLVAVCGSRAYVACPTPTPMSRLVCLDLADRRVLWSRSVPRPLHLLATEDVLYVRGPEVLAFDAASGRPRWTRLASGCSPMTADDGLLHLLDAADAGRLVALDRHTGRDAWEIPGIRSCDAFVRSGDLGFVKTLDGVVHAFALRKR